MAATATVCEHDDYTRHSAEPDVGIAHAYFECNDCGEYSIDSVVEEDYDDDGHTWWDEAPVWEDHDEDE